jgi:hypothetical protein
MQGQIYCGGLLDIGAFKFWRDPREFVRAYVRDNTVVWPAGVRLDPDVLYTELRQNGAKRCKPPSTDPEFARFMARALEPVRKRRSGRRK